MKKDEEEKKSENTRPNTQGSVVSEDEALTSWLLRFWLRNEIPERLEVYQAFGRNHNDRGEMIFHDDFKPSEKLTNEHVVKLTNEIVEACQNDCDGSRRQSFYQIAVVDRNRKAAPVCRRIGPLVPKRLLQRSDTEDDEDDYPTDGKSLSLAYIREGIQATQWDKRRNDNVVEAMLVLQNNIIQDLRRDRDTLMAAQMAFFQRLQDAEDRKALREIAMEKEKFKLSLYRDGIRTAQNMLPRLFAGVESHKKATNGNGTNGTNGAAHLADDLTASAAKTVYGPSPERTLVDNFLTSCEEEGEKLMVALFGDYKQEGNEIKLVKEGIFTFKQYATLIGVREGRMPVEAIDPLMPQSGHELEIKQEQIQKAIDAGVTQGMGTAIFELVGLRQSKKDEAEGDDIIDAKE